MKQMREIIGWGMPLYLCPERRHVVPALKTQEAGAYPLECRECGDVADSDAKGWL